MVELMHVSAETEAAYVASLPVEFRETYPIRNEHGRWIDLTFVAPLQRDTLFSIARFSLISCRFECLLILTCHRLWCVNVCADVLK